VSSSSCDIRDEIGLPHEGGHGPWEMRAPQASPLFGTSLRCLDLLHDRAKVAMVVLSVAGSNSDSSRE
jgi:hypothetical protein